MELENAELYEYKYILYSIAYVGNGNDYFQVVSKCLKE